MGRETLIQPGDRVQMRKMHPCGSDQWIVLRVGADFGLRCAGCQRRIMLTRRDFFRQLRRVVQSAAPDLDGERTPAE